MCHACIGVIVSQNQPLVSVLVPICNVEKYLDECLSSLINQTLNDIEIICINDGSTDSSLEIINKYASEDSRFVVVDKPNSGYGDSMNLGLEISHGKYIAILESDDFLDADALEYMVNEAESRQLEVFKCNFWLYWSKRDASRGYRTDLLFKLANPEMIALGTHCPLDYPDIFWAKASIWSALYLKSFLDENEIRFNPTPGASYQDLGFTFKVFACARRVAYSGRAFLHYRQDNEKSSVNSPGKVYCVCDEHDEIARFIDEKRPELKAVLGPVRAHTKFLNYRWNYDRLDAELKPEFLERFSAEMRQEIESGCIDRRYFDGSIYCDSASEGFRCFEPWEIIEIDWLANDPTYYAAHRACEHSSGKLETLKTYWNAGGLRYVYRALCGKK